MGKMTCLFNELAILSISCQTPSILDRNCFEKSLLVEGELAPIVDKFK